MLPRLAWCVALFLLAVPATGWAIKEGQDNRYDGIVGRNAFALRPPPPITQVEPAPPVPPQPLALVELTGVISIPKKKALVEIVPGPGQPMMKLTLDEGERVDAIELVAIDVNRAEITINNAGTLTNIALRVAKAGTGAGPASPALAGMTHGLGVASSISAAINSTHTSSSSPRRGAPVLVGGNAPPVLPTASPGNQPATAYGQPAGTGGGLNPAGGLNRYQAQTPTTQSPAVDPAVQYVNMLAQKQALEARGIRMPPVPPVAGVDP